MCKYIVMRESDQTVEDEAETEERARELAEKAAEDEGEAFIVYAKIGSARLVPRVEWKGISK